MGTFLHVAVGNKKFAVQKVVFCCRILRASVELDYLTVQIENIHFVCRRIINVIISLYSLVFMCQILSRVLIKMNVRERHYRLNLLNDIH